MLILLVKDGITQEVTNSIDVTRLKGLGYVEVKPEPSKAAEAPQVEKTAEQQNEEAIAEANKPAGSKKGRK